MTCASASTISHLFGGDVTDQDLVLPGEEATFDAALPDKVLNTVIDLLQKRVYADREKTKPVYSEDKKAADALREGLQALPVQDVLSYQSFLALIFDRIKCGSVCAAEFYLRVLLLSPMDRTVFFFHPMVLSAVMSLTRKQLQKPDLSAVAVTCVQRLLVTVAELGGKWMLSRQMLNQFSDIFLELLASNSSSLKQRTVSEALPVAIVHAINPLHGDEVASKLTIYICKRFVGILTAFAATPEHKQCRDVIHAAMSRLVALGKIQETLALAQHLCQRCPGKADARRAVAESVVLLIDLVGQEEARQEAVHAFIRNLYRLSKSQKTSHRILCVDLAQHLMASIQSGESAHTLLAIISERSKDVRPRVRVAAVRSMAEFCQKSATRTEDVDTRVAKMLESRLPDPKALVRMAALKLFETVKIPN